MDAKRLGCILSYQVFSFSASVVNCALLSLACDCLIAVLCPLRYRTQVPTFRRVFILNLIVIVATVIVYLLYPVLAFSSIDHGNLSTWCAFNQVFPFHFALLLFAMALIQIGLIIVFNFIIMIGVVVSLLKRNKIAASEQPVRKTLVKLSVRLVSLILINFGLTFPLTMRLMNES